jgi:hypothetical protein
MRLGEGVADEINTAGQGPLSKPPELSNRLSKPIRCSPRETCEARELLSVLP